MVVHRYCTAARWHAVRRLQSRDAEKRIIFFFKFFLSSSLLIYPFRRLLLFATVARNVTREKALFDLSSFHVIIVVCGDLYIIKSAIAAGLLLCSLGTTTTTTSSEVMYLGRARSDVGRVEQRIGRYNNKYDGPDARRRRRSSAADFRPVPICFVYEVCDMFYKNILPPYKTTRIIAKPVITGRRVRNVA